MKASRTSHYLPPGYTAEIDGIDEPSWYRLLQEFDDANIYQTWAYGEVTSGPGRISQLVLRKNGDPVAISLARIIQLPILHIGIAYVLWGPLWRRHGSEKNEDDFRQALRALRTEYVCKRGLTLRVSPLLFDGDSNEFLTLLKEEGFAVASESRSRTILMSLAYPIEELRKGMEPHWKRELKVAEKGHLEIKEGFDDAQFASFIDIYREMVSRKKFVEPNDINKFRMIQRRLPAELKMRVMLCLSSESINAGLISSEIGKTAVYLFGATSTKGMKSRGSYFLQWKLLEKLKAKGVAKYDLNGINPLKNPGTYKFKNDFAGTNGCDSYFLGRFDAHNGWLGYLCVRIGETLRGKYRALKEARWK